MTDPAPDAAARAWAAEILETRWQPVRFRLELEEERWVTGPGAERAHHQARFRVWELAGLARLDDADDRCVFPADPERLVAIAQRCAPPADPELVRRALERAAQSLPPGLSLQVRGAVREPLRRGTRRWAVIEKSGADGQVVIDYDPLLERRLGYLCCPFYRGSTRSAALSRESAVRRAQGLLGIPSGSRLSRAKVIKSSLGRVWRLRWEVDTAEETGAITASLNARTGEVCAFFSTVAPRPLLLAAGVASRERAALEIARVARAELGDDLVIGQPVPAAFDAGSGAPRAGWIAVIRAPDRRLYRALHDGERVELKLSA